MTATSKDHGPFDGSIHNNDGSHRTTAPTTEQGEAEEWRRRRDKHVAQHVVDAQKSNELIADDELLYRLADLVSGKTEGQVYFLYTTRPQTTVYYVFQGISGKHTRTEAIQQLTKFLGDAPPL